MACCISHSLQGNTFTCQQGPVENAESLHCPLLVLRHFYIAAADLAKLSGEELPAGRRRVVQLVVDDAGGDLW